MPRGKYARPVTLHANRFGKPRYEVNDEGCWIWLGAKMPKGYGTMKWEGKSRRATRVYYECSASLLDAAEKRAEHLQKGVRDHQRAYRTRRTDQPHSR